MKIHLIAICGTGMGSFAGILQRAGHEVRGSDENIYPPMSELLRDWNIPIFSGFRPENLDWGPDLVIIGNVIRRTNPEAQAAITRGIPYQSFPQAMGEMFLAGRHSIVVAGTHGKTTTSAMLAWLLDYADKQPGFLIGGALRNFPESFREASPEEPPNQMTGSSKPHQQRGLNDQRTGAGALDTVANKQPVGCLLGGVTVEEPPNQTTGSSGTRSSARSDSTYQREEPPNQTTRSSGTLAGESGTLAGESGTLAERFFVIEGDEYDTAFFDKGPKFLHYRPRTAIITSIEHDHADIYPNVEAVAASFEKLARIMPSDGLLMVAKGAPGEEFLARVAEIALCRVLRYGVGVDADFRGDIEEETSSGVTFALKGPTQSYGSFTLTVPGRHNVANAVAALGVALSHGCDVERLREGLPKFLGARRRQEERFRARGVLVVDDFAHHPTAVHETLRALSAKYQGRRLWALFEPRSATCRRNVLEPRYVDAFDLAEIVVITYAHRSEEFPPEERFDSERLVRNISAKGKRAHYLATPEAIADFVTANAEPGDVVILMSNGSFGGLAKRLEERLSVA